MYKRVTYRPYLHDTSTTNTTVMSSDRLKSLTSMTKLAIFGRFVMLLITNENGNNEQ